MLDATWLLAEGAAIALPGLAASVRARAGSRRMAAALSAPLFWEGGQAISLLTLYCELNGEVDLPGTLGEVLSQPPPATAIELERALARLHAEPSSVQKLVRELAADVVLRQATGPVHDVGIMERLAASQARQGFFAFVASLSAEGSQALPPLLPIEGLLPGGLPLGAPAEPGHAPAASPGGLLDAIGLGRQGEWLPAVAKAVEDLLRGRRIKKAREHYHQALAELGAGAGQALRAKSPAGQALRRNIFMPLDAYRNLATRARARQTPRGAFAGLRVPGMQVALEQAFVPRLAHAMSLVADKCQALERTLLGRHGPAHAGEVLYSHRHTLLAGVAPDAFRLERVSAAREAYLREREEAANEPGRSTEA